MCSYQAHQLLSLTLSNYSSISGNCTGISTANQRSLYTFETVWCDWEVTDDIIVTISTYSIIQRSLQVCNSCWVHLDTLTCAHYPNWVSVLQHWFKWSVSPLYTSSSSHYPYHHCLFDTHALMHALLPFFLCFAFAFHPTFSLLCYSLPSTLSMPPIPTSPSLLPPAQLETLRPLENLSF